MPVQLVFACKDETRTGKEMPELFIQFNSLGNTVVMLARDENAAKYARRVARITDGERHNGEGALAASPGASPNPPPLFSRLFFGIIPKNLFSIHPPRVQIRNRF